MLIPLNKYLIVKPLREEVKSSGVIIPADVDTDDNPYLAVELVCANIDYNLPNKTKLLVPSHMVEEVTFLGVKYYLVLETCVMGYERA